MNESVMSENFPFGWCSFHVLSNKLRHTHLVSADGWILQCDVWCVFWSDDTIAHADERQDEIKCVYVHTHCVTLLWIMINWCIKEWIEECEYVEFFAFMNHKNENKRCRKCGYLTHQDFLLIRYSSVLTPSLPLFLSIQFGFLFRAFHFI